MIRALSENVIVPIAGLVITYVLCVELISMVTEKNNMHDVDTFMFFKWFFKAWVAVYLITHAFLFEYVYTVLSVSQNNSKLNKKYLEVIRLDAYNYTDRG